MATEDKAVALRKRKPDEVTAKRQTTFSNAETLWFDCKLKPKEVGAVIDHGPGHDFITLCVLDEEDGRQRRIYVSRPVVAKLLPYLAAFAEGKDFGIEGETVL